MQAAKSEIVTIAHFWIWFIFYTAVILGGNAKNESGWGITT